MMKKITAFLTLICFLFNPGIVTAGAGSNWLPRKTEAGAKANLAVAVPGSFLPPMNQTLIERTERAALQKQVSSGEEQRDLEFKKLNSLTIINEFMTLFGQQMSKRIKAVTLEAQKIRLWFSQAIDHLSGHWQAAGDSILSLYYQATYRLSQISPVIWLLSLPMLFAAGAAHELGFDHPQRNLLSNVAENSMVFAGIVEMGADLIAELRAFAISSRMPRIFRTAARWWLAPNDQAPLGSGPRPHIYGVDFNQRIRHWLNQWGNDGAALEDLVTKILLTREGIFLQYIDKKLLGRLCDVFSEEQDKPRSMPADVALFVKIALPILRQGHQTNDKVAMMIGIQKLGLDVYAGKEADGEIDLALAHLTGALSNDLPDKYRWALADHLLAHLGMRERSCAKAAMSEELLPTLKSFISEVSQNPAFISVRSGTASDFLQQMIHTGQTKKPGLDALALSCLGLVDRAIAWREEQQDILRFGLEFIPVRLWDEMYLLTRKELAFSVGDKSEWLLLPVDESGQQFSGKRQITQAVVSAGFARGLQLPAVARSHAPAALSDFVTRAGISLSPQDYWHAMDSVLYRAAENEARSVSLMYMGTRALVRQSQKERREETASEQEPAATAEERKRKRKFAEALRTQPVSAFNPAANPEALNKIFIFDDAVEQNPTIQFRFLQLKGERWGLNHQGDLWPLIPQAPIKHAYRNEVVDRTDRLALGQLIAAIEAGHRDAIAALLKEDNIGLLILWIMSVYVSVPKTDPQILIEAMRRLLLFRAHENERQVIEDIFFYAGQLHEVYTQLSVNRIRLTHDQWLHAITNLGAWGFPEPLLAFLATKVAGENYRAEEKIQLCQAASQALTACQPYAEGEVLRGITQSLMTDFLKAEDRSNLPPAVSQALSELWLIWTGHDGAMGLYRNIKLWGGPSKYKKVLACPFEDYWSTALEMPDITPKIYGVPVPMGLSLERRKHLSQWVKRLALRARSLTEQDISLQIETSWFDRPDILNDGATGLCAEFKQDLQSLVAESQEGNPRPAVSEVAKDKHAAHDDEISPSPLKKILFLGITEEGAENVRLIRDIIEKHKATWSPLEQVIADSFLYDFLLHVDVLRQAKEWSQKKYIRDRPEKGLADYMGEAAAKTLFDSPPAEQLERERTEIQKALLTLENLGNLSETGQFSREIINDLLGSQKIAALIRFLISPEVCEHYLKARTAYGYQWKTASDSPLMLNANVKKSNDPTEQVWAIFYAACEASFFLNKNIGLPPITLALTRVIQGHKSMASWGSDVNCKKEFGIIEYMELEGFGAYAKAKWFARLETLSFVEQRDAVKSMCRVIDKIEQVEGSAYSFRRALALRLKRYEILVCCLPEFFGNGKVRNALKNDEKKMSAIAGSFDLGQIDVLRRVGLKGPEMDALLGQLFLRSIKKSGEGDRLTVRTAEVLRAMKELILDRRAALQVINANVITSQRNKVEKRNIAVDVEYYLLREEWGLEREDTYLSSLNLYKGDLNLEEAFYYVRRQKRAGAITKLFQECMQKTRTISELEYENVSYPPVSAASFLYFFSRKWGVLPEKVNNATKAFDFRLMLLDAIAKDFRRQADILEKIRYVNIHPPNLAMNLFGLTVLTDSSLGDKASQEALRRDVWQHMVTKKEGATVIIQRLLKLYLTLTPPINEDHDEFEPQFEGATMDSGAEKWVVDLMRFEALKGILILSSAYPEAEFNWGNLFPDLTQWAYPKNQEATIRREMASNLREWYSQVYDEERLFAKVAEKGISQNIKHREAFLRFFWQGLHDSKFSESRVEPVMESLETQLAEKKERRAFIKDAYQLLEDRHRSEGTSTAMNDPWLDELNRDFWGWKIFGHWNDQVMEVFAQLRLVVHRIGKQSGNQTSEEKNVISTNQEEGENDIARYRKLFSQNVAGYDPITRRHPNVKPVIEHLDASDWWQHYQPLIWQDEPVWIDMPIAETLAELEDAALNENDRIKRIIKFKEVDSGLGSYCIIGVLSVFLHDHPWINLLLFLTHGIWFVWQMQQARAGRVPANDLAMPDLKGDVRITEAPPVLPNVQLSGYEDGLYYHAA